MSLPRDVLMEAKKDSRAVSAIQMRALISPLAEHWPMLILGLLAAAVLLWGLGQRSLRDWDEAIYAQVSKEMVQSGEWLTLHYGYEPWYEKPPLLMWTTALFYQLFGVNEFWSRAASAFSGILLLIVTYLIGELIYGRWVGFLSAIILLSGYGFVRRSRLGMMDVTLTLFVFLAIYSYLRLGSGSQKWWYPLWASFGLAILTKSWAAVIAPAATVVLLFVHGSVRAALGSRHFWQGLLLALAIVAPWHILMYVRHGPEFIDEYVVRHLIRRTSTALEGHVGGQFFYVGVLQRVFSPWFYLMPFAVALAIRDNVDRPSQSCSLLTLLTIVFGVYTFVVKTKLAWYLFPVYPACAILAGATISEAFRRQRSVAFGGLLFAVLVSILIAPTRLLYLFALAVSLIVVARWLHLTKARETCQLAVVLTFIFLASIGAASTVRRNYRIGPRPLYGEVESRPVVEIARIAGTANPGQREPLIGLALEGDLDTPDAVEGPVALFYSDRPIQVAWTLGELAELTDDQERKEILLAKKYVESLSTEYEIHILAEVEPLVYATIRRRGLAESRSFPRHSSHGWQSRMI